MAKFGREFSNIVKGVEWVSINLDKIKKKEWQRYGSRTEYFEVFFGKNNWKYFYIVKNKYFDDEKIIKLISNSFKNNYDQNKEIIESWIEKINYIENDTLSRYKKNDRIFKHEFHLIALSFQNLVKNISKTNESLSISKIELFFNYNREIINEIPLKSPEFIIKSSKKQIWKENSIKSFFTNNLIVQVKTSILENRDEVIIAIFLRKDLKLGKGKKGAQLSHSAVSLLFQPQIKSNYHNKWISDLERKIKIFSVRGLNQLLRIENLCHENSINNALITDAGHTQINPGTNTCIAVGPLPSLHGKILAEEVEAIELVT